jgi:hypothetical protein
VIWKQAWQGLSIRRWCPYARLMDKWNVVLHREALSALGQQQASLMNLNLDISSSPWLPTFVFRYKNPPPCILNHKNLK